MNRTVLIASQNSVQIKELQKLLKEQYALFVSNSIKQIRRDLLENANMFSAILLDVADDSSESFEALHAIRANALYRQIPVLAIVNTSDINSQVRCMSLGANGCINKPINAQLLKYSLENSINLHEKSALANTFSKDSLTGLLNRKSFFDTAEIMIKRKEAGYYVLSSIDIENFKVINDQYGLSAGDSVLIHVAQTINKCILPLGGICCRFSADKFASLYPAQYKDSQEIISLHEKIARCGQDGRSIKIRIGRYMANNLDIPISAMYDRATIAEESIRGRYDVIIAQYSDSMRTKLLHNQRIVNEMASALAEKEFEPWFQPQYNHATGALIGAEALVRWRKDGKIIPPNDFISVFEQNGFIYELDQYLWRSVCDILKNWIDKGLNPLPVSINISRYDILQKDFLKVFFEIVREKNIPFELLRLEITESAFSESSNIIIESVKELINKGFTVEIDDFGSGYSSLNTLKDVPATILKLDMKFFENTENSQRGGNIIESVVRMAKWLGMAVIAEGVEDKAQADYLKSIGCYYIQGYYYARPMPLDEYEALLIMSTKEPHLNRLQTLKMLNNNEFWNPKSIETLIFNSYVGGACIFEYVNHRTELLRISPQYTHELGGLVPIDAALQEASLTKFLDEAGKSTIRLTIQKASKDTKEASCEVCLKDGSHTEYIRITLRQIARAEDRQLFYAVIVNITEQKEAQRLQAQSSRQLKIIMDNISGGVSALQIDSQGNSTFVFNNDKYYELYGYTRAQALKEKLEIMKTIVKEDYGAVMAAVKKLYADRIPQVINYRIIKRDGSLAYLRANASLMYMEGFGDVITSIVTDETATRELEDRLYAIINNINGGVTATVIRNGKPEFIIVNDQFYRILGYSGAEDYNASLKDKYAAIHPEDKERVISTFESMSGNQSQYMMEYRIIRKDGCIRYIRNNISVIHLMGVEEPVQLSVASDITDLRLAQARERAASTQLKAIMDNINGGIVASIFHDEGNVEIVFANDVFYEMYGYTKEQINDEVGDVLNLIVEPDKYLTLKKVAQIVKNRGSETYEYRCRKRDGSIMWVRCSNSVISIEGVADTILLAVTSDITDLRATQQQLADSAAKLTTILNNAGCGITVLELQTDSPKFLFSNEQYYEITGYDPKSYAEATSKDLLSLIYPDDREWLRSTIVKLNKNGGRTQVEYRVIKADGSLMWMRSVISVTHIPGIEAPVQIGMFVDITDEKDASDQLRFLNKSAHDILARADSELAVDQSLNNMLDYFVGDRAYVMEINYQKRTTTNTYEKCAEGVIPQIDNLKDVPFDVSDYWISTLEKNEYIVINDVSSLDKSKKELKELLEMQSIISLIIAPIFRDGSLIGFVGIDNPRKATNQLEGLKAIGDFIAIILTGRDLNKKIESERTMMSELMDGIPGAFVRMKLSADGTFIPIYANEGFSKLTGMSHEQLNSIYGHNVLNGVHPIDRGIVEEAGAAMLRDGTAESARFRVKNGSGEYIWLSLYGSVAKDASGTYLNVYYSDATKQVEEEQKEKNLLDNLPCGAALYEYDGKKLNVVHINKSYWNLVARKPVDYSKASVFDVIHPDDRAIVYQEITSAIRQGRNAKVDLRIRYAQDSYKPFSVTASFTNEDNGKYLCYVAYTPIPEKVMSVQQMLPIALSTMMSASEDLSFVKDTDLRYICCSDSAAKLLGLANPDEVIGKTDIDLFGEKLGSQYAKKDKHIIKTGEPLIDYTERIVTGQGEVRLSNTSKYPILDTKGNVIGLYGVSRDITAQRQKESQLELLTKNIPGGLATYAINDGGIKMLYCNDGYYKYSGYTREEYLKLINSDPLAFVYDEDKQKIIDLVKGFSKNKVDGHENGCVYRYKTKGGSYRWMSIKTVLSKRADNDYIVNVVQLDITEQQEERERLKISEEVNRLAIALSGNIITRFDVEKRTLTLPDSFNPIFVLPHVLHNMPEEQIALGRVSPDTADTYTELFESIIQGKRSGNATYKQNSTKGFRWLEASFTTVFSSEGKPVSAVISFTDVTEELEKEVVYNKWQQSLNERDEDSYTLFRCNLSKDASFDSREGSLIKTDFAEGDSSFNQRTAEFTYSCVYEEDRRRYTEFMNSNRLLAEYYRGNRSSVHEFRIIDEAGSIRWIRLSVDLVEYPSSKDVEIYLMYEDIDEQKKSQLLTLERSEKDPLTGVYNRSTFITKMEQSLADSAPDEIHALFMLDIDNFKQVNDVLGHGSGDRVLINLTQKIGAVLRHDDIIGRMGGDEFFVFLKNISSKDAAAAKAKQICGLSIGEGIDAKVTVSVGISLIPRDGKDFDTLYKKVDRALYNQKAKGKNGYMFVV